MVVLIFLANWLLNLCTGDAMVHYWVSLVVYLLFFILLLAGPANKHTANDNTSGVITLLEIYQAMDPETRQQVCFVFFDNEEKGLIGSGRFRKQYRKDIKQTLMINFDCVSDGDHFLLGISKKANRKHRVAIAQAFTPSGQKQVLMENLKKIYYPSDQSGFPLAIAVAALKYTKPFGYYMDRIHTKRDTVFQQENIAYLTEKTLQLIDNIN
jgi:Zn-dependent M28 family amino/carboxypeptidase